ncbi:MAG: RsmB/NOP family class I SAM-dependent RNA methyltransferase [Ignavibacteriales bacterium]|nr:RsmB/NOP family class I SAM-dependent RNA methyltransferase [Ignavibacteriales bacterium]
MIKLSDNIVKYISSLYGDNIAKKYFEFVSTEPSTYIRLKKSNLPDEFLINRLSKYGIQLEKVNELPNAYKIISGVEIIGKTLESIIGKYYVQSKSSMVPPLILSPNENDIVLDLCSAPGSKTTEIADLMNNKGTIISNEPNLDRIKMLIHNIDKMSLINIGVIQFRGEWLNRIYHNYFDKILVDAPCSALGVVQKKGEVSNWWSTERVENLTKMQLMILTSAIKMAKIGGEIVYSTCTLTPEENELVLNHVLNKYPLEVMDIELPIKSEEAFTSYKGEKLNPALTKARRILPWEVDSDGFFIIKMKKIGEVESSKPMELKESNLKLLNHKNKLITSAVENLSETFGIRKDIWQEFNYLLKSDDIFFTDKNWNDANPGLFTRIGTRLGLFDKHGKTHLHSFAAQFLADEITKNIFQLSDENQLKDYMNGGIVKTKSCLPGQQVVKFEDIILGTGVLVQNGLKSQFPKSKRTNEIKLSV